MEHFYCSICGTAAPLEKNIRLIPEPYASWDCIFCFPVKDLQALEIKKRDLRPCQNCGILTKRIPVCSTECLIQKELDNEPGKVY